MTCYHPLQAWRSKFHSDNGSWPITFDRSQAFTDMPVTVPCGQCIGCRLDRSRQWAMRCVNEAQLHDSSCFITLTYDNEHLPDDGSLNLEDITKFLKRLRFAIQPRKFRYFQCGEYGELLSRPHHHAIIFGFDFPDRWLFSVRDGVRLYRSPLLERLWPFGFSTIGDVTFESCAYVARYVTKKITGERAEDHYQGRKPEFITMSRRPGIGHDWCERFVSDVYPRDLMVIRDSIKCRPPRYYDSIYDQIDPDGFKRVQSNRRRQISKLESSGELSIERMKVKEALKLLQFEKLVRPLENGVSDENLQHPGYETC